MQKNQSYCSLLRRILAGFYDCLCLLALFFLATLLILVIDGEAVDSHNIVYDCYLLLIVYFYFTWHWVNGGQTLGMCAWHIKICDDTLHRLTWRNATLRFCLLCVSLLGLGFGFFWVLFDPEQLTFHDRYSRTRLFRH